MNYHLNGMAKIKVCCIAGYCVYHDTNGDRSQPCSDKEYDPSQDVLPDMSAAISSTGRGSMQRRIAQLEQALRIAEYALNAIAAGCDSKCLVADRALGKIEEICGKGTDR